MRNSTALSTVLALLVSAAPAAHAEDDRVAAREHYRRATTLYDLRRYREAAKEYEAAFEAKDDPSLLFNAAQAYRLGGEFDSAVGLYRSYLRRVPNAPNHSEIDELIVESLSLKARQEELERQKRESAEKPPAGTLPPSAPIAPIVVAAAPPPPPAATDSGAPQARAQRRIAGIAVGAAGVALLGVGVACGVLAKQAGDQISHPTTGQLFDPALESKGATYQTVAMIGYVVGGLAVAGGVALLVAGREPSAPKLTLAPVLAPGHAGASLQLRF
jgi:tetratricopeptide (TPR) repeat protein